MSHYRPLDAKREEFRRYLEKSGVMEALTKVLVGLYEEPEKPNDALDYVKKHLGDENANAAEVEKIKAELEEYKSKIKKVEEENEELKKRLAAYEPNEKEEAPAPE